MAFRVMILVLRQSLVTFRRELVDCSTCEHYSRAAARLNFESVFAIGEYCVSRAIY